MRCHQARLRITEYNRLKKDIEGDRELREHLRQCPRCARDLEAHITLGRLFTAAAVDDASDMISLERQKARVISMTGETSSRSTKRVSGILGPLGILIRKPALGFGVVLGVMVLAILTLVPFQFHRTIGYTITVNGVDVKLAGDIDRICGMLLTLGLEDALVDIIGCDTICTSRGIRECDTTCKLMIVELRTREEAERVVQAFARIDADNMTTSIEPVRTPTSSTLLHHANEVVLQRHSDIN